MKSGSGCCRELSRLSEPRFEHQCNNLNVVSWFLQTHPLGLNLHKVRKILSGTFTNMYPTFWAAHWCNNCPWLQNNFDLAFSQFPASNLQVTICGCHSLTSLTQVQILCESNRSANLDMTHITAIVLYYAYNSEHNSSFTVKTTCSRKPFLFCLTISLHHIKS